MTDNAVPQVEFIEPDELPVTPTDESDDEFDDVAEQADLIDPMTGQEVGPC